MFSDSFLHIHEQPKIPRYLRKASIVTDRDQTNRNNKFEENRVMEAEENFKCVFMCV